MPLVAPTGKAPFDNFGTSVAGAGDVNGDGYDDVLVGAPRSGAAGANAGRAYLYLGGAVPDSVADLVLTGQAAGDAFGTSVATIVDLNADGFADFIVGAPGNDAGGSNAGRAYVYFGSATPDAVADLVLTGQAAGEAFGTSVAGARVTIIPGPSFIAIGAPGNSAGGTNAGRVYIFKYVGGVQTASTMQTGVAPGDSLGASVACAGDSLHVYTSVGAPGSNANTGRVYIRRDVDLSLVDTFIGEAPGDRFGSSACFRVDGVPNNNPSDVVVGAPGNDAGGSDAGQVYFRRRPGPLPWPVILTGEAPGDRFGGAVSILRHTTPTNPLIAIGAAGSDVGGADAGRVCFRRKSGPIWPLLVTGEAPGDGFGASVASAGDVNGDGFEDVIVGAPYNDAGGTDAGRAYLYCIPEISEGIDSRTQAQDAFPTTLNAITPGEHFSPSTNRFGTCAFSAGVDLGAGTSPNLITADSITVQVSGCADSLRWCGAIVSGPHAGKAPSPYTVGANGFFCMNPDSVRTAGGQAVPHKFFVDLDDTYFRGGDRLVYFWSASGGISDPPGLTTPPVSVAAAEAATGGLHEVSFLPTITWSPAYRARIAADPHGDLDPTPSELAASSQTNCILLVQMVDTARRSGPSNRTALMYTLDNLGYRDSYDVYDVQGYGNTNNQLGSRASVQQATGYGLIIQDTGSLSPALPDGSSLVDQKINQARWYRDYLAAGVTSAIGTATLWLIGENIVQEKPTNPLITTDMGVSLATTNIGVLNPDVTGVASNFWADGSGTSFVGDRFSLDDGVGPARSYDGLAATGTAVRTHRYSQSSTFYSGAIIMNKSAALKWNTVMTSFPWADIRDFDSTPPPPPLHRQRACCCPRF